MASTNESNSKVNPYKVTLDTDDGINESEERRWGMPLKEVYKHGLSFYKDKEGKAMHLSYEDKLKLVAYTQQTAHGPLDVSSASPLGVLDVIGRDRRSAWQALGNISQVQAMAGFVHTLDRLCPLFKPYLEAIQKDLEDKQEQELKRQRDERAREELQARVVDMQDKPDQINSEEDRIRKIKDALNNQTYEQFRAYAQQQFPANFDQQAILIRQLQDQHYQQYIQQLAIDMRLANCSIQDTEDSDREMVKDVNLNNTEVAVVDNKELQTTERADTDCTEESREEESDGDDIFPHVGEPRMWTSPEIVQFKESARQSGGRLVVGHGETLTVRVPTHPRARSICWEFATDNYDLGFGMYFEWSKSPTTEVTIHVSESDEEDDLDDGSGEEDILARSVGGSGDPERGAAGARRGGGGGGPRPLVSPVVPIYRRDCHTEVYAGSHMYPGEGVYLLKFDNTYSLWRSKTLYYKVYYTQ